MTSFTSSFGSLSATVHGLVVSAILIPAAISSLFAGNVADVYGEHSLGKVYHLFVLKIFGFQVD